LDQENARKNKNENIEIDEESDLEEKLQSQQRAKADQ